MPHAIEWSFATPKTRAFLPSSRPIGRPPLRAVRAAGPARCRAILPAARLRAAAAARARSLPVAVAIERTGGWYCLAMTSTSPAADRSAANRTLREALEGVSGFVLDADGV